MDKEKKPEIIVIHETLVESWLKDAMLFGSVGVLLALNHIYWGGSIIVSVLLIVALIFNAAALNSKTVKTFNSYEDVKKYINSQEFDNKKVKK
jgi:hypothetical protein